MKKLIIFDLDGVLVDIKNIHYEALNNALPSNFKIDYNEHLLKYDGKKTFDKLDLLGKEKGLPKDLYQEIYEKKQNETIKLLENIGPQKNIIETLEFLKNKNFKITVASNSIRNTIKNVLLKTGYIKYIDFFLSNEDVMNSKPNPEIFLRTMITANVGPKETIIVEDSPIGIRAAECSGGSVIQVKNSTEVHPDIFDNFLFLDSNKKWSDKKLNIVIPMAGEGSRFMQVGYSFPKPLIEVNGDPMIKLVVDNINIDANYIFIVQKKHYDQYGLKYLLNLIAPNCKIVIVDRVTSGAACTVLLSKDFINNENPLIIANSDQYVSWDSFNFMYNVSNSDLDGSILTFNSIHPKWSFAKISEKGLVTEVAEKAPISNIATVGIYYWKKGQDFVKYAEQMIDKNIRVNNEFYVCPVFNEAISDGKLFNTYQVSEMWGLGTPEDLDNFLKK